MSRGSSSDSFKEPSLSRAGVYIVLGDGCFEPRQRHALPPSPFSDVRFACFFWGTANPLNCLFIIHVHFLTVNQASFDILQEYTTDFVAALFFLYVTVQVQLVKLSIRDYKHSAWCLIRFRQKKYFVRTFNGLCFSLPGSSVFTMSEFVTWT